MSSTFPFLEIHRVHSVTCLFFLNQSISVHFGHRLSARSPLYNKLDHFWIEIQQSFFENHDENERKTACEVEMGAP